MKQQFLTSAGLSVYDEEIKEYISQQSGSDESQMLLGRYNTTLTWSADGKVYTETWTYNGSNYKEVLTEASDTQYTKELFVNDISVGLWTMTIDETNNNVNTVYTER